MDFCNKDRGQLVDFNPDHRAKRNKYELLKLSSEPWRKFDSSYSKNRLLDDRTLGKTIFSNSGSKARSKRSKTYGASVNENSEEIDKFLDKLMVLASTKTLESCSTLKNYAESLKTIFGYGKKDPLHKPTFSLETEDDNGKDNILFSDLVMYFDSAEIGQSRLEHGLSHIYHHSFWDSDDFVTTTQEQLMLKTKIGVGSLARLLPTGWLTHDMIELLVDVLFRNRQSKLSKDVVVLQDYWLQPIFDPGILKERFCEASLRINKKNKDIFEKKSGF